MSAGARPETVFGLELGADGSRGNDLIVGALRGSTVIEMDGGAVFRFATTVMVDVDAARARRAAALGIDDVDWIVPHQANVRIIDNAVKRLGADPARVLVNLERYGNTSAASIPLCLEEAWSDGRLKKGDRVLMVGFGGGLTWGSCLTEWAARRAQGEVWDESRVSVSRPGIAGGRDGRGVRRRLAGRTRGRTTAPRQPSASTSPSSASRARSSGCRRPR